MSDVTHEAGRVEVAPGLQVHFEVVGEGPDTVLVTNSCFLSFDLDPLADRRRLVFVDSRGRGASDPISDLNLIGMDCSVDDLEMVREHLGAERVSFLGWSGGGNTACYYAMDHPNRVNRVMTVGFLPRTGSGRVADRNSSEGARTPEDQLGRLEDLGSAGVDESDPVSYWREHIKVGMRQQMGRPEALDRMRSRPWACPNEWGDGWTRIIQRVREAPTRPRSRALSMPTLLVYGKEEQFPLDDDQEWVWEHRDTRLVVMPGVGHYPWLEDPGSFFAIAETFLSGGWPDGATRIKSGP